MKLLFPVLLLIGFSAHAIEKDLEKLLNEPSCLTANMEGKKKTVCLDPKLDNDKTAKPLKVEGNRLVRIENDETEIE